MEPEEEMAMQNETKVLRWKMKREGDTLYFFDLDGVRSR